MSLAPRPYYASTYTQHIVRADGTVKVNHGVPFTDLHAAEVQTVLQDMPRLGMPLFKAVELVNRWNNAYNGSTRFPDGTPHFPRFFYTVECRK